MTDGQIAMGTHKIYTLFRSLLVLMYRAGFHIDHESVLLKTQKGLPQ